MPSVSRDALNVLRQDQRLVAGVVTPSDATNPEAWQPERAENNGPAGIQAHQPGVPRAVPAKRTKPPAKPPEGRRSPAEDPRDKTLGYAEDAGHPGGLQDLRAKTDTEAEHDVWERHG
jgi:hypothetical protein